MTGGLLLQVQIYENEVYVPTKEVIYDSWSLITVVLNTGFTVLVFSIKV